MEANGKQCSRESMYFSAACVYSENSHVMGCFVAWSLTIYVASINHQQVDGVYIYLFTYWMRTYIHQSITSHHDHHITSHHIISYYITYIHGIPLPCLALPCIVLHYSSLQCITLHYIALHDATLRYHAVHCIALHCIIIHCVKIH